MLHHMKQDNYCHYGSTCRRNQHGKCHYKHRKDEPSQKNEDKPSSKAYYRERERSRSEERPKEKDRKKHKEHKENKEHRSKHHEQDRREEIEFKRQVSKPKYEDRPKYQQKPKQSEHSSTNQNKTDTNTKSSNRSSSNSKTSSSPFEREFSKFCKSYHLQDICDDKHNCNKIHGFMFKNNDRIKRRFFKKSDKYTKDVKLCSCVNEQTVNYIVKNQEQVIFYNYTPAINDLKEIEIKTFQKTKSPKKQYFGYEGANLYFSFANEDSLTDLICFQLIAEECFQIKNAHLKDVTGMVHLNQQQIISVSLDGTIKIWNFDRENLALVYDNEKSLQFKNMFNAQDKKMELQFIEKTTFEDKELIFIGTRDSRLLVFINQNPLSFTQIVVDQIQLKILKMKKISKASEPFQMLVLANSREKSYIYRITIEGVDKKTEKLVELDNIQSRRIRTFQSHEEMLFVSYGTQIIIYQLNNKATIVGGIQHHSPVRSMAITECFLKTTALSIYVLAVLQGASSSDKKDGLLSFYFIR